MIALSFFGGMLSVIFVLPLQKIVYDYFQGYTGVSFVLWATIEEIFKFGFVYFIALRNKVTDEPFDYIIYLIISALGFVTMENTLFLITPLKAGNILETVINSNLRFVGASLLHIVSSATLGVFLAISFYKNKAKKRMCLFLGIVLAIALHTAFNLLIINGVTENIFFIFGSVWLGIIILLLVFEKIKSIKPTL